MAQRTITGKLVDAARNPLSDVNLRIWPDWPTVAGIPMPDADEVQIRAHFHVTTDAAGTFTLAGLTTTDTGPFTGWAYRMQFTVGTDRADLAFTLPAGASPAQLSDVMVVTSETTPGQWWIIDAGADALAAAAQATAAAARIGRGFRLSGSSTTVPNDTATTLAWSTTEYADAGVFTIAGTTATCQVAGRFQVTARVQVNGGGTTGFREVGIRRNGIDAGSIVLPACDFWSGTITATLQLAVGDTLQVRVKQTSGATRSIERASFEVASLGVV